MFGSIPIRIIFAIQTRSNSNEMISIQPVLHNKKQYLDLLLLADEQESMIDRYLERGEMFVLSEEAVSEHPVSSPAKQKMFLR